MWYHQSGDQPDLKEAAGELAERTGSVVLWDESLQSLPNPTVLLFGVLVTLHPNIERYDLYIRIYIYVRINVYTYIYVHISRIMGGFSMKIPEGTCAASLSQDSRGTSTSLSHLAGQIDDRRFSCGHYPICCF